MKTLKERIQEQLRKGDQTAIQITKALRLGRWQAGSVEAVLGELYEQDLVRKIGRYYRLNTFAAFTAPPVQTDEQKIEAAISQFPAEFGLKAYAGRFRISRQSSYISDVAGMQLYTEIQIEGGWTSFCKGTVEELKAAIIPFNSAPAETGIGIPAVLGHLIYQGRNCLVLERRMFGPMAILILSPVSTDEIFYVPAWHFEGQFEVKLSAEGAPTLNTKTATLYEAVQAWISYRDQYGLGASQMGDGCGMIRQAGKIVAKISYNGRLWDPQGRAI